MVIIFEDLQRNISYTFKDTELLKKAFTHSSYAFEHNTDISFCNERLEFLGDAVVELSVRDYLYNTLPHLPEGKLTKLRASLVCAATLSHIARNLSLGDYLLVGKGEEISNGRNRESTLADVFEAMIGAIYLDSDFVNAKKMVLSFLRAELEAFNKHLSFDSKTTLQELIQRTSKEPIIYKIIEEIGPPHDKLFVANVIHRNTVLGKGSGRSKKEAEQNAASEALKKFE